jgi:hypothetical protein
MAMANSGQDPFAWPARFSSPLWCSGSLLLRAPTASSRLRPLVSAASCCFPSFHPSTRLPACTYPRLFDRGPPRCALHSCCCPVSAQSRPTPPRPPRRLVFDSSASSATRPRPLALTCFLYSPLGLPPPTRTTQPHHAALDSPAPRLPRRPPPSYSLQIDAADCHYLLVHLFHVPRGTHAVSTAYSSAIADLAPA